MATLEFVHTRALPFLAYCLQLLDEDILPSRPAGVVLLSPPASDVEGE